MSTFEIDYEAIKAKVERDQEYARSQGFEHLGKRHASTLQYGDRILFDCDTVTVRRIEQGIGEEVIVIEQGTGKRWVLRDFGSHYPLTNTVWRPIT